MTEGEQNRIRTFPGTVEAARRVELAFRVSGLLAELPVTEGQEVAKGDLIAQLRQDEFSARLATLQGELDQARASLGLCLPGSDPKRFVAASRRCGRPVSDWPTPDAELRPLPIACRS